ncbi:MAG: glycosyltransferase [Candidatus Schekmanbacteria bacterium]|nr:MAG: glycosyltransferase [Candidatus Schekmanbacteria bacterium]
MREKVEEVEYIKDKKISVVIPLFNEEESINELYEKLSDVLKKLSADYEIIFIDDGSTDSSYEKLLEIFRRDKSVIVAKLRKNVGKAWALSAGFKLASGDIVFTMDADLQDEPSEIPLFLKKLNEGYDLVSGWKKRRNDPLTKVIPSRIFNWFVSFITGIKLHDFNCGFKAYRREVIDNISIYGELHRYIPVLAERLGYKTGEVVVKHNARKYGFSKYGIERFTRGFLDMLTVILLTRYRWKPLHFFGSIGLLVAAAGFITNFVLLVRHILFLIYGVKAWELRDRPLLSLGVLLIIVGIQFISIGLLAEVITVKNSKDESGENFVKEILKRDS